MDSIEANLRPCPFCGAYKPAVHLAGTRDDVFIVCDVERGGCGAITRSARTITGAANAWNKRDDNTCELVVKLKRDGRCKRTNGWTKDGWIHCSRCGELHSGTVAFTVNGNAHVMRHKYDGEYCPHCGGRFTNPIDELEERIGEVDADGQG